MKKILVGIITTFSFLQIQPHSSINSMINGGFKDKLSKEQTQIINQLPSTRLTAAKAFSGAHQLYSSNSGSLLAKQEIDKSTPAPAPATTYDGTITLTDNFLLMNGSFDRVTSNTNPIVNGNVKISSYGNITNMDDVDIDGDGTLTKNDNDDTLGTKEVIIEGNVVITGEFKLNGSGTSANIDLIVKGNLTVNAYSASASYPPPYVQTDYSASITVEGDILFDGKNSRFLSLHGYVSTTTDAGTITIQNNKGTDNMGGNYATKIQGKLSTINGDITIQNSHGYTPKCGVDLINSGSPSEISSATGTITFYGNDSVLNGGGTIKTSGLGNIIFENNYNASTDLAPITLQSGSSTRTEGSGNILIQNNRAGEYFALELANGSTLETTGSGEIIISDNRSTTNDCVHNKSGCTIRTTDGNISFNNNEAGGSSAAVLNEGTIETTAAGNISFANNEDIDNSSGIIQTTGTGSICASDNGTVDWGTLATPPSC